MSVLTDFHVFWGAAMGVAQTQSASMEADGAEDFARLLYGDYVAQGAPKNKKRWLSERLKSEFLCLNTKPVWVGEPAWLYYQGHPMVFLHQFSISPSAQHLGERIPLGDTLYVFGSKQIFEKSKEGDWTVVYRTAVQTPEGETVTESL